MLLDHATQLPLRKLAQSMQRTLRLTSVNPQQKMIGNTVHPH